MCVGSYIILEYNLYIVFTYSHNYDKILQKAYFVKN